MSKNNNSGGGLLSFLLLAGVVGAFYFMMNSPAVNTINQLMTENTELKTCLTNLKQVDVMGKAKLVGQTVSNGVTYTTVKFAHADPDSPEMFTESREYTVMGREVFYDAMVIKFNPSLVEDGTERAMYFWRRLHGSDQRPSEGIPLDKIGKRPERYDKVFAALPESQQGVFWDSVWELEQNPEALVDLGVRGVVGKAVYKRMQPDKIYTFRMGADGNLDMDIETDF